MYSENRDVVQLVERVLWEHEAAGSSPVISTKSKARKLRCQKKLITISRSSDDAVTFYFDDSSICTYDIRGSMERTFLYNVHGHNAEAFYELGISDPHALYRELGILTNGDRGCPECRREDLNKVFEYLLKNYSVEPEEFKEELEQPGKPSEWDWLLD